MSHFLNTDSMKTPRATLYEENEMTGGSIYWEPNVEGIPHEKTSEHTKNNLSKESKSKEKEEGDINF